MPRKATESDQDRCSRKSVILWIANKFAALFIVLAGVYLAYQLSCKSENQRLKLSYLPKHKRQLLDCRRDIRSSMADLGLFFDSPNNSTDLHSVAKTYHDSITQCSEGIDEHQILIEALSLKGSPCLKNLKTGLVQLQKIHDEKISIRNNSQINNPSFLPVLDSDFRYLVHSSLGECERYAFDLIKE